MKRLFLSVLALATSAWTGLCRCTLCAPVSRQAYIDAPTIAAFNDVRRRDLLDGEMHKQAAPTRQATRRTHDQRPGLQFFTLSRNDFAF